VAEDSAGLSRGTNAVKQRIITGVIWGVLLLALIWIGGLPFSIFLAVLSVLAFGELIAMRGQSLFSIPSIVAYIEIVLFELHTTVPFLEGFQFEAFMMSYGLFALAWTVVTKNRFTCNDAAFDSFGLGYLAYGFQAADQIRSAEHGLFLFVLFQLTIWATDTGAYFVGRALGGRKLWPEISPKKTISGSTGGAVVAALICACFTLLAGQERSYPVTLIALFALIVSISGQLGDLVESAVKRHYGIKDSGTILPGHGGIFDRLDSFVFAAPIAYGLLQWWF
jgi:phosphatidate cytidylyltransferase